MQDLSGNAAVIGGGSQTGESGYLLITPGTGPDPSTGGAPPQPGETLLDVENWHVASAYMEHALAGSGQLGAMASRRVGYSYAWDCEVVLDLRRIPETLLRYCGPAQILFLLGDAGLAKIVKQGQDIQDFYYWCPLAKVVTITPMVDPHGKTMDRVKIGGTATGHILICQLADLKDPGTIAGAYNIWTKRNTNG